MTGTKEGGQKAAETRKEHDSESFSKMGQKGGKADHGDRSASARKAAETVEEREPGFHSRIGQKGGESSHGGQRK